MREAGKIDDLDRKILGILMNNARIPFRDVAEQCHISRAAVHQRVQRMEDLGVITGSGYKVSQKFLGYQRVTYIGITLEKAAYYNEVVNQLERIPEITECYCTLGPYSVLVKLFAKDDEHLMNLLNTKVHAIKGVLTTLTFTCLDTPFNRQITIE